MQLIGGNTLMIRGNLRQNISNIEDYLFGTPEEQLKDQEHLKDDLVYRYLPFIVGAVAIGFMLFIFHLANINQIK